MVEAELTAEGKKTKGGIVVGHSEDLTFYSSEESADIAHEADIAQVCATVYKIPDKLYYDRENPNNSMPWDCDMEIQVGDLVWYNVLESRNAIAVECDGYAYKLIPYRDCYCVKGKRLNPVIRRSTEDDYHKRYNDVTICLNGYVLLEPIFLQNISSLAVNERGDIDKTKGIVRYVGKPNMEYLREDYIDFPNLEVGDEVLLSPKTPLFYLERKKYLASFDNDKLYWVVQRRRIAMVLSKGN